MAWHRNLDLCTTISSPFLPSIDHTHLLEVLDGCPSLQHLGLRFDATKIASTQDYGDDKPAGSRRGPYPRLHKLSVGESPISSPEGVTEFLNFTFPNLKALDMSYSHRPHPHVDVGIQPEEPEAPRIDEVWDSIRELLGLGFDLEDVYGDT